MKKESLCFKDHLSTKEPKKQKTKRYIRKLIKPYCKIIFRTVFKILEFLGLILGILVSLKDLFGKF